MRKENYVKENLAVEKCKYIPLYGEKYKIKGGKKYENVIKCRNYKDLRKIS